MIWQWIKAAWQAMEPGAIATTQFVDCEEMTGTSITVTEADREQGATDMERAYPRREPT